MGVTLVAWASEATKMRNLVLLFSVVVSFVPSAAIADPLTLRGSGTVSNPNDVTVIQTLVPISAFADPIRYTFTYEPFRCPLCLYYPGFSLSFVMPSFIKTTGMFELPKAVSIGADTITHAGTNNSGEWVFGNGNESISDLGFDLEFDTLAFEYFSPTQTGYIDHTGTFSGYFVQGATSHFTSPQLGVDGRGTVSVSAVPEPGTLLLIGTGALAAMGYRRQCGK